MADKSSLFIQKIVNVLIWLSLLAMAFVPEKWIIGGGPSLCLHKMLTGYECPLCGLTKSTWSATHFHFQRVIEYNPVWLLLFVILVVWSGQIWLGLNLKMPMKLLLYLLLLSFLILYLYRLFFQTV